MSDYVNDFDAPHNVASRDLGSDSYWRRLARRKWQVHLFNTKTPLLTPYVILFMVLFVQLSI
ncbi:MAG: hypothetical protein ACOX08_00330 [Methanobacterium sp.]